MIFETIKRHIDPSLEMINRDSLDKLMLADIIEYCQERGLKTEGDKSELIEDLISWKENIQLVPAPSTPRLFTALELLPDSSSTLPPQQRLELNSHDKNPDFDIPYHTLVIGKKLGSGGFKDCYAAIGELRLTHFNQVDLDEIKHEINVLKQLRHENVIRFIGVCTHPEHLCIITELCSKGDLFDVIRNYKKPNFSQLVMYMYDIALGVSYLHTRRPSIIHRDLKSMNILISGDDRAKVNDFGLARIRPKANILMHTHCGTPNWQAPEYWSSNPSYTEKVDVSSKRANVKRHYTCICLFYFILGLCLWFDILGNSELG
ncbi:kinase-like domain-containing protein [Cokeromyces recurvatus]|uniref:kinase-like domain-containing protein n=1 Tax=Cokeromyces recurvatus TaxID=90255 RepID=UPI00222037E6|nr:kinase-like domain-containing protein [Cokeromyces recurvatus]KAI7904003.1 kinase-like domain-containing protein [Cokeromyces recurvatus]